MKRLTFMVLLLVATVSAYAQKPVKPNLNKALKSLTDGKYEEAKANIDAAVENEKMKNDGKTWYYRGLIYSSIDTSFSNPQVRNLDPNAFSVALESFAKSDDLNKGKSEYFTQDQSGLPIMKSQQIGIWANTYLNRGAGFYQNEEFETAAENFELVQKIIPEDTTAYFYAAIAAQQAASELDEEDARQASLYDRAIENFNAYLKRGGKSQDAWTILMNTYAIQKKDKEKALQIVREARKVFPNNLDYPKVEIGYLIDMNRTDEAKAGLESALKREPNNKILHFFMGYANSVLKDFEAAKKNYQDALKIDPKYFEAQLYLAKLMYNDAAVIKKEMSNLGITAEDKKKRFDLDKKLVEKLKVSLPYWEQAERINPADQEVLDALYTIYTDLDMVPQVKRIEARYKELGMDN
jgi:tetratricopeptide (TPR) repeat protein